MLTEITVFLSNEYGHLAKLLNVLHMVNIQAYSIEQGKKISTMRLIVSDPNMAWHQLKKNGYDDNKKERSDVLGILLSHRPGQLQKVASLLGDNKINIEYSYLTVDVRRRKAVVIMKTADQDKAENLLRDNKFELINEILESLQNLVTLPVHEMEMYPERNVDRLREILEIGESSFVEFKSSMRYDLNTKSINKGLGTAICKAIASFMNTNGGVILVGVDPKGNPIGLQGDFGTLQDLKTTDGFQLVFSDILRANHMIAYTSLVNSYFLAIDDKEIFVIEVYKSSKEPVWLNVDEFWVRVGSSNQRMSTKDALTYIKTLKRW